MLRCVMCITNNGTFERFDLGNGHRCTIDNITVKMSDGTRLKRYAVCLDGRWHSNQQLTLREARRMVEQHKQDFSKPVFKPIPIEEMRQIAREKGAEQAYNLLLLGGYGFIEGTCKDYDNLLAEFKRGIES